MSAPRPRSLSDFAAVPPRLRAEQASGGRGPSAPITTSSAVWQRPSFKSVELNVDTLNLEAALAAEQAKEPGLTPVIPAVAPRVPSAQVKAPSVVPLSQQAPPVPEVAAATVGTIEASLREFLGQLVDATGAAAAFVADADGLEMANHLATPELLAVSALMGAHVDVLRSVLHADTEGSLAFELDADNVLQVLWAETELGRLAVGLVVGTPLAAEVTRDVRAKLRESGRRPTSRRAQVAPQPAVNDSVF